MLTALKRILIITLAGLALSACATTAKKSGQMQGDVYTGSDTVEFLATGVRDRVFFATNKTTLTTASSCLLYTSPSPRDRTRSRMPSSA